VSEERALAPERVAELIESGEAQVIDVRTPAEHEAGHIGAARHVPLESVTAEVSSLDPSKPLVFYCRGGERSGMAAEAFAASGWDAYNMDGGLVAWAERGLPLEPEGGVVAERSLLPGA
jgi:rhodanese-related sulfurtransferase